MANMIIIAITTEDQSCCWENWATIPYVCTTEWMMNRTLWALCNVQAAMSN